MLSKEIQILIQVIHVSFLNVGPLWELLVIFESRASKMISLKTINGISMY